MKIFDTLFNVESNNFYGVTGLNLELNCIYVYNTFLKQKKSVLVVANSLYEATNIYQTINNYTNKVLFFPMDDFLTSEAIAISPELKFERINTLNKLVENDNYIVVTNLMGYLRYLPPKKTWNNHILSLKVNQEINRDELIEKLYMLGYEREPLVTETGKIGIRGYVIDIFPIGSKNPVRIEFWGDNVESIKYFDIDTQLSFDKLNQIKIYPVDEFIIDTYDDSTIKKQKYLTNYSLSVASLSNYLDDATCFYYDYHQLIAGYKLLRTSIFEYDTENETTIKTNYMYNFEDINHKESIFLMNTDNVLEELKLKDKQKYISHNINNYQNDFKLLVSDLNKYLLHNKTVILCLKDKVTVKRIVKYLDLNNLFLTDEENILPNKINIINKVINSGFIYNDLVVISERDLFNQSQRSEKYKNKYRLGTKISSINNIKQGDYIVHEIFGIGIYDELCTITKNGIKKDYLKLKYADGDVLYIPVENIDRISKFSGREGIGVKINKLGTDAWKIKKAKIKSRLEDIAESLLKISAEREAIKGFAFSKDDESQVIFDNEFAYKETNDQLRSINQIKEKMEKENPMDMLLCGDVGYGKTEVAFRAMFKAINDGKQVAYLCPTTILSNQQYSSAMERFANFPINIALLNRFVTKNKQAKILEDLKKGNIDILIGTHRILSEDIEFKDLGLLVVDEEQRFGVKHKEKIKSLKANIDILTLSATPIPRTLQMSMTGIRSLSLIETPPEQRYPIQTYVLPENKNVIKDAIYKELSRKGQTFILFNNIQKIESKVKQIQELVPEAKIDFAHGQMNKLELEKQMLDFIDKKFDVLVCTTIIETGIDIPNVNTLIIIDADHYGLSQLYQIRGRIGRSNKIGYAYLMYSKDKILNEIAIKRLETIKEFTELGSGFKIAMRDLSIRGAGDILGKEQSGFIDSVGIDLYLKMLNETVKKLKGEEIEEEPEIQNEKPLIEISTHISEKYTDEEAIKIEIHKKINEIDSLEKLNQVKEEIEDRFGIVDRDLKIYMYEEWFDKMAKSIGITKVTYLKNIIDIELPKDISSVLDGEKLFLDAYEISNKFKLDYKNNKIHLILNSNDLEKHYLIYLIKLLLKIKEDL